MRPARSCIAAGFALVEEVGQSVIETFFYCCSFWMVWFVVITAGVWLQGRQLLL